MPFNALNFTDLAKTAYDQGRETGRQIAVQNALKDYAKDPAATQNALIGIGAFPEAKQVSDFRQQAGREKAGSLAASGDMAGARTAALGAGNFDAAAQIGQMSAQDIAAAEKRADTFGAVGVRLKQYPYEQRRAALAQLAPWLEEQGFTPDMIAKFDPSDANIDSVIGQAQTTKEALQSRKTQTVNRGNGAYDVVAEDGGDLVRSVEALPQGKAVTLKDAAGNEAVYVIDEATGQPIATPQAQGGAVSAPGSLAARNNNPGNLRPDGSQWQGMTGESGGFVTFDTPENGMRAARINLGNQAKLHGIDNLNDLFAKWAPASDSNDPVAYAKSVSQMTGIDPNAKIDLTDPAIQDKILPAIAKVEGGGTPSPQAQRPAGGMRPVIATPNYGQSGATQFRPATAEEKQAHGIDPTIPAQTDTKTGKVSVISGTSARNKPMTESQAKAGFNASRMLESSSVLDQLEGRGFDGSLAGVGAMIMDDSSRIYQAAKMQWADSLIRETTGAAATKQEVENVDHTYFPQPGDSPKVRARKAEMRKQAQQNTFKIAGEAGQQAFGQPSAQNKTAKRPSLDDIFK